MRLIDANALREHLLIGAEFADENTLLTVLNTLDCEITIDPESLRPKGRWENGVCTACKFDLRCLTDGENDLEQWVWDEGFDYCPNCGLKMEG